MSVKKLIPDAITLVAAAMPAILTDTAAAMADTFTIDLADILETNLPPVQTTDETTGETVTYAPVGMNEDGQWLLDADPAQLGTLALVIHYDSAVTVPAASGEPLATPTKAYLINLPSGRELFTDSKLTEARDKLLSAHFLASARKIAKAHAGGETQLVIDRTGALLSVTGRGGAAKLEAAYSVMFKSLQQVILLQAKQLSAKLRERSQHAKARDIENVFSASRLNKADLRAAFSSKAAAEALFPSLPQAQWEALLRMAIDAAPRFAPRMPVKDPNDPTGRKTLKDAEGKTVTQIVPKPQSPVVFSQWLATRDQADWTPPTADDSTAITFDGLSLS